MGDFGIETTSFDEGDFNFDDLPEKNKNFEDEFKESDPEQFGEDMESWDSDLLGTDEDTWGPAIQSGTLNSGDECALSYDCISACCAMNIKIDDSSALVWDTTKSYTDAEVEALESTQDKIISDGIISYLNYGVKQYYDSESDS